MALYNDPRYVYDQPGLDYDGLYHIPAFMGNQPSASGTLTRRSQAHRTLTGNQPVVIPNIYDAPGISYDQSGVLYDSVDAGQFLRRAHYHRVLVGDQQPPTGSFDWTWRPYTWAEYTWDIGSTPEETVYATSVTQDDQVQYLHEQAHDDPRTEAEYTHRPLRPHTRDEDF